MTKMYEIRALEHHNENFADKEVILAIRIFACFLGSEFSKIFDVLYN